MVKPNPPRQLSDFAKAMRKQYASSRGSTKAAEKMNILQSPKLQLFVKPRTGQPLKGEEWRS